MDYKAIVNLMNEMNCTELTRLEIEEQGVRICMEKTLNNISVNRQPELSTVTAAVTTSIPSVSAETGIEKSLPDAGCCKKIVSPMVGTFYVSSSPDKPAFVKIGDKVKKGQTICIIEAMKLMNEIESEHDGEIAEILVDNEEMVEYGQPLFLIK